MGKPITNRSNKWSRYHANLLYKIALQVRLFFKRAYDLDLEPEDLVDAAWLAIARYRSEQEIGKHAGYIRKLMLRRGYEAVTQRGELIPYEPDSQSLDDIEGYGEPMSPAQMEERFDVGIVSDFENWELVRKVLRGVRNTRMAMIALQYYLLGRTMGQIGERMGLTRERVRQILQDFDTRAKEYVLWQHWNER